MNTEIYWHTESSFPYICYVIIQGIRPGDINSIGCPQQWDANTVCYCDRDLEEVYAMIGRDVASYSTMDGPAAVCATMALLWPRLAGCPEHSSVWPVWLWLWLWFNTDHRLWLRQQPCNSAERRPAPQAVIKQIIYLKKEWNKVRTTLIVIVSKLIDIFHSLKNSDVATA